MRITGERENGETEDFATVVEAMATAQNDLKICKIVLTLPSGESVPLHSSFENSKRCWKVGDSFLAKIRFWEDTP